MMPTANNVAAAAVWEVAMRQVENSARRPETAALRHRREMSDLYKNCPDTHKTGWRAQPSVDRRLGTADSRRVRWQ